MVPEANTFIIPAEEAAPGVAVHDVEPVNRPSTRPAYVPRKKIHPRLVHGRFRTLKWALLLITLGIYYSVPWLRWERGPNLPNQAVLVDVANGRMYLLGLEIWPQDLYLLTGLLVLCALGLFLVTAIAGRVWCGYFCPQTVWTDLMIAVERLWQGDRSARIRLDSSPWNARKILLKGMTHVSWIAIALATGGAWVFYFADAPTLAAALVHGTAPQAAYFFIGLFSLTTYLLGGLAREQVCIYMCPWPRIQGAMFDSDSLLITYRDVRGEPRGPLRKSQGWQGRGDCIDCKACVAACPMGIDIRDGMQLECIQCALCIDACDDIMDKVDRPRGLIAYDTFRGLQAESRTEPFSLPLIRPRTLLYSGLIVGVSALMLWALAHRSPVELSVLPDREPMYVRLSDGGVRNGYTIKILNKRFEARTYALSMEGLASARLSVAGEDGTGTAQISVVPDNLRELRVFVTINAADLAKLGRDRKAFRFIVRDLLDGTQTSHSADFRRPLP